MYNRVTPKDVAEIVESHVEGGRSVRRLIERRDERAQDLSESPRSSDLAVKKDGDT